MAINPAEQHKQKGAFKKLEGTLFAIFIISFFIWGAVNIPSAIVDNEYSSTEEMAEHDASAQIRLAGMYYTGWGSRDKDPDLALRWYQKAERNGSEIAKDILCEHYEICN